MKRNNAVDVISGIFVIEIIVQHILQNSKLYDGSFYSKMVIFMPVFMPWFYFKAGMMYKGGMGIKTCIKYRGRKLLRPFIIWSIIPSLLVLPAYYKNNEIIAYMKICIGSLYHAHGIFNSPLWFLVSLFFCYILAEYVEQFRLKWGG